MGKQIDVKKFRLGTSLPLFSSPTPNSSHTPSQHVPNLLWKVPLRPVEHHRQGRRLDPSQSCLGLHLTLIRGTLTLFAPQIRCHCVDCSLTSGSAFSSNVLAKEADVKIDGDIGKYTSKAASGNDVTRIFCKQCGTPFAHNSSVSICDRFCESANAAS